MNIRHKTDAKDYITNKKEKKKRKNKVPLNPIQPLSKHEMGFDSQNKTYRIIGGFERIGYIRGNKNSLFFGLNEIFC